MVLRAQLAIIVLGSTLGPGCGDDASAHNVPHKPIAEGSAAQASAPSERPRQPNPDAEVDTRRSRPSLAPTPEAASPAAISQRETPLVPTRPYEDSLGGLRLGMTVAEARAVLPTLKPDGPPRAVTPNSATPGPTTRYEHRFVDGDVSMVAISKQPTDVARVQWISAEYDATLGTSRGIAIGSKLSAMRRAYPKRIMPLPGEYWVRFSEHEMLVMLTEGGRVISLMLGPAMDPEDLEE